LRGFRDRNFREVARLRWPHEGLWEPKVLVNARILLGNAS
jgi:hypothetical protein